MKRGEVKDGPRPTPPPPAWDPARALRFLTGYREGLRQTADVIEANEVEAAQSPENLAELLETLGLDEEEIEIALVEAQARSCRVCNCTDDRACEGGCHWVGPDLCSECEDEGAETVQPSDFSTCASCGFFWLTGTNGSHSCAEVLRAKLDRYVPGWRLRDRAMERRSSR